MSKTAITGPLLAIDSSIPQSSVGIYNAQGCPQSPTVSTQHSASQELFLIIRDILLQAGLTLASLGGIALNIGPGSFTGLRVGLASAKGICRSLEIPLLAVHGLAAQTRASGVTRRICCPVMDARKSQIYGAAYQMDAQGFPCSTIIAPGAYSPVDFLDLLQKDDVEFCGTGQALLPTRTPAAQQLISIPAALASMAYAGHATRFEHAKLSTAAPIYLRASEAELTYK